jgi:hypothetical protein
MVTMTVDHQESWLIKDHCVQWDRPKVVASVEVEKIGICKPHDVETSVGRGCAPRE